MAWVNLNTVKEPNNIWVEWFAYSKVVVVNKAGLKDGELTDFLLNQLQTKAKADLKKADNPFEAGKTWKPTFGKKTKSTIEKLRDQIGKLSKADQDDLKGLL